MINKFINSINFKQSSTSRVAMYFFFALFVFFQFGLWGIRSNIDKIKLHNAKTQEHTEQIAKLDDNINSLEKNAKLLQDLQTNTRLLDDLLPKTLSYEEFVEFIIDTSAGYGYGIEKIEFAPEQNQVTIATVEFSSENDDADTLGLIASINTLPRLSIVEKITYEANYGKKQVKIGLKIFTIN